MEYSVKELLSVLATRLRSIAEDTKLLTTGNLAHNGCAIRGRILRNAELIEKHLNRINATKVDSWHKQSEEDIDDSFNDWSLHRYVCLMKDGSIQEFTACQDECYDGSINLHLDCVDDEYEWEYDDILYWVEVPFKA